MTSAGPLPLSILDLAFVDADATPHDAFEASVAVARRAEQCGYRRVWYAEHHNMASIASSATSVLIAHVANHTATIRLGAGGVMLPNHSPLVIAEQFGTLETLHPGRIDLGLGRAPGTDEPTMRAMRRSAAHAETFPSDVRELQGFLSGESTIPGVKAVPGDGTNVPLYILGSSLFGARLAAIYGLPYGFASHFAPDLLERAVALYRAEFQPSSQLTDPHVIAGVNVVAADTAAEAAEWFQVVCRSRARRMLGRGPRAAAIEELSDEQIDDLLESPQGVQIAQMMRYTAVGDGDTVEAYLQRFAALADADELITVHAVPTLEARLRSVELVAKAHGLF